MMRNISFHLWLATLFSVPAVFFLLRLLAPVLPGLNPVAVLMMVFIAFFAGFGTIMDFAARKTVDRFIQDGQTWERSGVINKAQTEYLRAIRLYDSFLFWPFFSRRIAATICGAIAKFNVNARGMNPNFNLATAVYLKLHPADEDVALPWLKHLQKKSIVSSLEQEVLTVLAGYYTDNPVFLNILAGIFIRLERQDFAARKLYRQMAGESELDPVYKEQLRGLIGEPKDERLEKQAPFIPARVQARKKMQPVDAVRKSLGVLIRWSKTGFAVIQAGFTAVVLAAGKAAAWVRQTPKARTCLKTAALFVVFGWLFFFMANTLIHMFKSRTIETAGEKQIATPVLKPFTIQVAAYLKQKHADRYVTILEKKGIDASVKRVDGGGKTWFLVRVSEFADKQSAAEYGMRLKQQKIIDDFFVNNK